MSNLFDHPIIKARAKEVAESKKRIESKGLDSETFCLMPFVNLILEPDGSVGLCRQKGTDFTLGYIQDQSINEIWNGPFARRWRREFLQGKPHICETELKHKGCQLCPSLNSMLSKAVLTETQAPTPLRLTANFNGRCNLQCQMCDVWKMPNGLYNDVNFWEPAKKDIFPFLHEIDMLSGEPFIQPDTYRLIDEVSAVNPDCLWSITTNMHWKLNDRIEKSMDKIKFKNLIMSIDSLNAQTYYKIRYPGKLDIVMENFKLIKDYEARRVQKGMTGFNIHINFLIQKDNWKEAREMIKFCLDHQAMPFLTFLYRPEEMSLLDLPENEREEILDYYFHEYDWSELVLMRRVWSPLVDSLPRLSKASYLTQIQNIKSNHTLKYGEQDLELT